MAGKKDITISVRLDEESLNRIQARAEREGVSRAVIIRRLLAVALDRVDGAIPSLKQIDKQLHRLEGELEKVKQTAEYAAETVAKYQRPSVTKRKEKRKEECP